MKLFATFIAFCCLMSTSQADLITSQLGNTAPGFANGDIVTVPTLATAQTGQAAPFNAGIGQDLLLGTSFTANWTFNYVLPAGQNIVSASIRIGIADHDSMASGNQVAQFQLDGIHDLTGSLNTLFEASGGSETASGTEYNEYVIPLSAATFAALADGSALFQLDLQGPSLVFALFPLPGAVVEQNGGNGAFLVNSTLAITTAVPEPSGFLLLAGLSAATFVRTRRRRFSTSI